MNEMNETTALAAEPTAAREAPAADTSLGKSAAALSYATAEALKIADAQAQCAMHLQIARGWKELAEVVNHAARPAA